MRRPVSLTTVMALILVLLNVSDISAQRRRGRRGGTERSSSTTTNSTVTVPAGTIIKVRMDTELNSPSARVGAQVIAIVIEPVHGGGSGVDIIPVGCKLAGRISALHGPRGNPDKFSINFTSLTATTGKRTAISAKAREAVFNGGGAMTGAIINAVTTRRYTGAAF